MATAIVQKLKLKMMVSTVPPKYYTLQKLHPIKITHIYVLAKLQVILTYFMEIATAKANATTRKGLHHTCTHAHAHA